MFDVLLSLTNVKYLLRGRRLNMLQDHLFDCQDLVPNISDAHNQPPCQNAAVIVLNIMTLLQLIWTRYPCKWVKQNIWKAARKTKGIHIHNIRRVFQTEMTLKCAKWQLVLMQPARQNGDFYGEFYCPITLLHFSLLHGCYQLYVRALLPKLGVTKAPQWAC